MRSLVFCFISLFCCAAQAAWRIESRPLEKAPWGRAFAPMVEAHTALSHLEGAGVRLQAGVNDVFTADLPDGPARELELQLAFLSSEAAQPKASCPIDLEMEGAALHRDVPLRSVLPSAEPFEALRSGYDYLAPALRIPLSKGPHHLRLVATLKQPCEGGQVLVYDPKIWVERPGAARRFLVLVADSLSADWFEGGRDFMPFTRRWFGGPHAAFSTRVWSAGSNTHDTTNVVGKMQFRLRADASGTAADDELVRPEHDDNLVGLLPAFLNAGYDAVTFNSNLLLSSAFEQQGFRNFYNLNNGGSPNNDRNPEILVAQLKDWLARHPQHDVLAFLWFDNTHEEAPAPAVRASFAPRNLPYASVPRNQAIIAQQARAMSYVDMAIESLAQSPLVEESDAIFFTDHGINFRTLYHREPLWGSCSPNKIGVANQHLEPVELRIPVGVRLHGARIAAPKVASGLLDWIKTAVRRHDASIDVSAWEGRDLDSLTAESPILVAGHGARATMFAAGRQLLFSSALCSSARGGAIFLAPDGSAAPDREVGILVQELARRSLLRGFREMELRYLEGSAPCSLEASFPLALDEHGAPLLRQRLDGSDWYAESRVFVPEVVGADLLLHAAPAGCAAVEVGNVQRLAGDHFSLIESGLPVLQDLPPARLVPGAAAQVQVLLGHDRFSLQGGKLVRAAGEQVETKSQLSSELRAAMKRWGYIQDDAAE